MHIILSFKTDADPLAGVWKFPPIIGVADNRSADNQIFTVPNMGTCILYKLFDIHTKYNAYGIIAREPFIRS